MNKEYEEYTGLSFDFAFEGTEVHMKMTFDLDSVEALPEEFSGITGADLKGQPISLFVTGIELSGFSCSAE